jgi:hypothetical protein
MGMVTLGRGDPVGVPKEWCKMSGEVLGEFNDNCSNFGEVLILFLMNCDCFGYRTSSRLSGKCCFNLAKYKSANSKVLNDVKDLLTISETK